MYITRSLERAVLEASKYYPIVTVWGLRQAGKSTMLYHIREPERKYVTLDDIKARTLAQTDPVLFFQTYQPPLIIDEFQRVPSILLELKRIVDMKALSGEDYRGMYWLTGKKDITESLAGRTAVLELSTLSSAEIDGRSTAAFHPDLDSLRARAQSAPRKDVHSIYESIFRGGLPALHVSDINHDEFYMDYVQTYLDRDVSGLAQVGDLGAFSTFLSFMASRTSQTLRYDDIASSLGLTVPTVREWVSILESSGLIYILRPYFSNITQRLIKTPKFYFMDTGLAAYLCRWPNAEILETSAADGAFLETYVVSEIVKSRLHARKMPDLYYYRDEDQREIDLLIAEGDRLYPMEIKKNAFPQHADRHFSALNQFGLNVQPGIILCLTGELVPLNRNTWLFPISAL